MLSKIIRKAYIKLKKENKITLKERIKGKIK